MTKILDFNKSVHDLCGEYPELKEVMASIGFPDIAKPTALNTVGRIMTIPKGASIKGLELSDIIKKLEAAGFAVRYGSEAGNSTKQNPGKSSPVTGTEEQAQRFRLLKSYIARLSQGEELESVRKDFLANFQDVDALEITRAEQALIREGMPIPEVQRLCDVHSALFHGATREEQIANAEKEVSASYQRQAQRAREIAEKKGAVPGGSNTREQAGLRLQEMIREEGHPLQILTKENEAIAAAIQSVREAMDAGSHELTLQNLRKLRSISGHYAKKGDLIYPLLKTRYEVTGPSDVMWSVDDEIRDEIRVLCNDPRSNEDWKQRVSAVLTRAEEMIYKENHILFPICVQFFEPQEWLQMSSEILNYDPCLMVHYPAWKKAEEWKNTSMQAAAAQEKAVQEDADGSRGRIELSGGHFTGRQLEAVLDTIPMELTFVDENNKNSFFNDGEKLFKRPKNAIGRDVFSCHPPKVEAIVRQIISDFREGKRDSVEIWHNMKGEPVLVRYMAVRDKEGSYVGTLECVQRMGFAKEHFEK